MKQVIRPVVERVELLALRVPFSAIARSAMDASDNGLGMAIPAEEPWDAGDFVYACLTDEDGETGWGEVFVWLPETGVSPAELVAGIGAHLSRYVLGSSPFDLAARRARMDRNVARNEVPKGLYDLACHDLAARQVGRPVHDLIGGKAVDRIPLCGLVPLGEPADVAAISAGYVGAGYGTLRLKLGVGPDRDRAIVAAVREAVGEGVRLRVDYNQAYRAPEAIRALRLIEPFAIDAAEQPVPVDDPLGMVTVAKGTAIPVFAHEGVFGVADVVSLIELGGSGVVGINTERPGGITAALELIGYAAARGLGVIIHNQSLGLGTAAQVHLAAARWDQLGHAVELAGDVMFDDHLVVDRLRADRGTLAVPTGPGFGVTVDRDALDRFLVADPVVRSLA